MRQLRSTALTLGLIVPAVSAMFASRSLATFHEWRIDEIYSDSSGTVQFVELKQASFEVDNESFVGGQALAETSLAHSFAMPSNLPSAPAANSFFLVATPGYAALAGVPAPDYVFPSNNWLNRNGDTVTWATFVDSLTFTGAQLPSDGSNSLMRAYGATALTTGVNSPTNFAGVTGSISAATPEPASLVTIAAGLSLISRRRRSA